MTTLDQQTIDRVVKRGVARIIPEAEFVERLREGKPLRLKMGFDPSRPDLHLGHVVGLRKLRQLQDLGHELILIVGDWTGPDRRPLRASDTRTMLDAGQVRENAETYMRQFFRVVDPDRTRAVYQSEWFGKFTLADVIRLTSRFTVNQFLHRDDFANRYAAQRPIAVTELLYPLLQAYDSVAIEADVEFGGTDQLFNLLVGRELQEKVGQRPQAVFTMPILPGTDGVRKMSKSLNNYIAIEDSPEDMFGKTMSLPDDVVALYFELLTDVPDEEVAAIRDDIERRATNPMDLKKHLGEEIVATFHSPADAAAARAEFERVVQRGETPADAPEIPVSPTSDAVEEADAEGFTADLSRLLVEIGLAASRSEARRLLQQRAVQIDGERPDWRAGPRRLRRSHSRRQLAATPKSCGGKRPHSRGEARDKRRFGKEPCAVLVNWNVEVMGFAKVAAKHPRFCAASGAKALPTIVCLTEAHAELLPSLSAIQRCSQPDYGYSVREGRRKVVGGLWSREPWRQMSDDLGDESLPPGRFVSGVTSTPVPAKYDSPWRLHVHGRRCRGSLPRAMGHPSLD